MRYCKFLQLTRAPPHQFRVVTAVSVGRSHSILVYLVQITQNRVVFAHVRVVASGQS